MASVVSMKSLLEAGVHFGHQTRRWNPKMAPYIYTERNGIYIVDLQKTVKKLEEAYAFVRQLSENGQSLLFVGTKKQAQEAIKEEATRCGQYYVNARWLGGMMTNFKTMRTRVDRLNQLKAMQTDGTFDMLPKKEVMKHLGEIEKLEKYLGGVKDMKKLPGALFIVDTRKERNAIAEAHKLGIPVVVIETKMEDYGAAYEKLGELLGMEDRGKELSDYCKAAYDETVSVMSKIPEGDRAKVAYLLGDKGTNTIAKNSYQGQVIDLVADNVADLGKVSGSGAGVEIGMEQLAIWDPAVILFGPDSIYDTVGSDAAFADLSAVKNGSYYKVPGTPWNWLNSPPTVNQVLGMQWLPRLLYPEQYDNDLYKTVAGYFKTFYGYDLSESEFNEIAANAQPKA